MLLIRAGRVAEAVDLFRVDAAFWRRFRDGFRADASAQREADAALTGRARQRGSSTTTAVSVGRRSA